MPVAVPVGPDADQASLATAHMVSNIIDYTRWPEQHDAFRLCVVGQARYGAQLGVQGGFAQRRLSRQDIPAFRLDAAAGCDVLYLGDMGTDALRKWAARARGAGVLTIAEHDPDCRSDVMFCLIHDRQSLSFQLNIDAVARSGVRVDPRVLRLARGGGR